VQEGKLFVVDAHSHDGRRFIVWADELLTAFLELEFAGVGRETPWVSIIFAVLLRQSLGLGPKSYSVPTGRQVGSSEKGGK
jgi:hypothetical protein